MSELNREKLTTYLDSLSGLGIPSVDCIVSKDHEQIYRHMNGCVDIDMTEPVRPDQRYLMFSMTKVQTMTAVMQLIEQGRLSLDDEVAKYLPAYAKLQVKDENGIRDLEEPLRIWHLLSMQSGLDYDLNRPLIIRVLNEKGKSATTRELVDAFAESPLLFEPWTHFLYSLSHDVAAAVIEVISGMSFGEYLKKNIPGIRLVEPEGTYLAWLDCRRLGLSDNMLYNRFLLESGVRLHKGSTFGKSGEGFMRLNFACPHSVLQEAVDRIKRIIKDR